MRGSLCVCAYYTRGHAYSHVQLCCKQIGHVAWGRMEGDGMKTGVSTKKQRTLCTHRHIYICMRLPSIGDPLSTTTNSRYFILPRCFQGKDKRSRRRKEEVGRGRRNQYHQHQKITLHFLWIRFFKSKTTLYTFTPALSRYFGGSRYLRQSFLRSIQGYSYRVVIYPRYWLTRQAARKEKGRGKKNLVVTLFFGRIWS